MNYLQPQYGQVSIDSGNPLTIGMVSAIVSIGGVYYEVFSGQTARNTGTQRVRGSRNYPNSSSISFIASGSGGAPKFTAQIGIDKIAGPFTVFAEASLEVNGTTQDVFKSWESGAGLGLGLAMDDSAQVLNGFTGRVNNSNSNFACASTALGANSETATHRIAIDSDGTNRHTYAYGVLSSTIANSTMPTASANRRTYMQGGFDPSTSSSSGSVSVVLAWNRMLSAAEHALIGGNPWQVFLDEEEEDEPFLFTLRSTGLTGTFASTLGNDSLSASGAVANVGSFASTVGGISMSSAGAVTDAGALASTMDGFTMSAAGIVGTNATGSLSSTLDGFTMMATGQSSTPIVFNGSITRRRARPRIPPKS